MSVTASKPIAVMIYKGFALSVLIGAPLIVLAVQSFVPAPQPAAAEQAEAVPQSETPMAAPVPQTPAYVSPPTPEALTPAGQPMAGAGQPMLVPGSTPQPAPPTTESPAAVGPATPPAPMNF